MSILADVCSGMEYPLPAAEVVDSDFGERSIAVRLDHVGFELHSNYGRVSISTLRSSGES